MERFTWDDRAPAVARYFGVISQIDEAVGIVLEALEQGELMERTVVVYTSDHGDLCGSHGMIDKHYVMYDDVVRVPLIIHWPGATSPGGVCDAFINHAPDLAATLPLAGGRCCRCWRAGRADSGEAKSSRPATASSSACTCSG